jgi:hypothetical protein
MPPREEQGDDVHSTKQNKKEKEEEGSLVSSIFVGAWCYISAVIAFRR